MNIVDLLEQTLLIHFERTFYKFVGNTIYFEIKMFHRSWHLQKFILFVLFTFLYLLHFIPQRQVSK